MNDPDRTTPAFCPRCRSRLINPGANFCPVCGMPLRQKKESGAKRFFKTLFQCCAYIAFFFAMQSVVEGVAMFICGAAGGALGYTSFDSVIDKMYEAYGHWSWLSGMISAALCVFLLAMFFKIRKKSFCAQIELRPLRPAPLGGALTLGFGAQFAATLLIIGLYALLPSLADNSVGDEIDSLLQAPYPVLDFIHIGLTTAIVEEVVFRGIVYNKLKRAIPVPWAMILSGVMFGIAHMNIEQFVYTVPLGIIMAASLEKYGSIIAPIAIHFAFNGGNYLIGKIPFTNDWWYTAAVFAGTGLMLIALAFMFFTEKSSGRTSAGKRKSCTYEAL